MKIITQFLLLLFALNLTAQSSNLNSYSIAEKHTLYSKILKESREILIHLPPGFWGLDEALDNYAVAFVLDGESQFMHTTAAIDFLSSAPMGNDNMPRTIVVGIPNTNRNRDFTPTKGIMNGDSTTLDITGGGPKFLDFIIEELTPYLDSLYATSTHRTLIGHSLGGLFVFEALLDKREHFTNYLAIDPALNFDNESYYRHALDTLNTADLSEENLFVATAGTLMNFLDETDIEQDTSLIVQLTRTNQKFLKAAKNANWKLNYTTEHYPDENHFSIPYSATHDAFKYFYSYYSFKEIAHYYHPTYRNRTDLVLRLKAHYQMISKKLGYTVIPMEGYINSWAFGMAYFKRADLAEDLFDYGIELYPTQASIYNSKGYFLQGEGRMKEAMKMFEKSVEFVD